MDRIEKISKLVDIFVRRGGINIDRIELMKRNQSRGEEVPNNLGEVVGLFDIDELRLTGKLSGKVIDELMMGRAYKTNIDEFLDVDIVDIEGSSIGLIYAYGYGIEVNNSRIGGGYLSKLGGSSGSNFIGIELVMQRGISHIGSKFEGCEIMGNLSYNKFRDCVFSNCNFSGPYMDSATFEGCWISGCTFKYGIHVRVSRIIDSKIIDCDIDEGIEIENSDDKAPETDIYGDFPENYYG